MYKLNIIILLKVLKNLQQEIITMIKSPFRSRKPEDFRILLFYPNLHMSALMPQSIGIFTSILKKEGYTLDLFDCTYYKDIDSINLGKNANQERMDNRNAPIFSQNELSQKGVKPKWSIREDFIKKIQNFKPYFGFSFREHILSFSDVIGICATKRQNIWQISSLVRFALII